MLRFAIIPLLVTACSHAGHATADVKLQDQHRIVVDAEAPCKRISEESYNDFAASEAVRAETFIDNNIQIRSTIIATAMEWLPSPYNFPGYYELVVATPAKMKFQELKSEPTQYVGVSEDGFVIVRYEPLTDDFHKFATEKVKISCMQSSINLS